MSHKFFNSLSISKLRKCYIIWVNIVETSIPLYKSVYMYIICIYGHNIWTHKNPSYRYLEYIYTYGFNIFIYPDNACTLYPTNMANITFLCGMRFLECKNSTVSIFTDNSYLCQPGKALSLSYWAHTYTLSLLIFRTHLLQNIYFNKNRCYFLQSVARKKTDGATRGKRETVDKITSVDNKCTAVTPSFFNFWTLIWSQLCYFIPSTQWPNITVSDSKKSNKDMIIWGKIPYLKHTLRVFYEVTFSLIGNVIIFLLAGLHYASETSVWQGEEQQLLQCEHGTGE